MNQFVSIVLAIVGSGLLTALVTVIAMRDKNKADTRKSSAEANNIVVATADNLIEAMSSVHSKQMTAVEEELKELKEMLRTQSEEIQSLKFQITLLKNEIHRLGGDPDEVIPSQTAFPGLH